MFRFDKNTKKFKKVNNFFNQVVPTDSRQVLSDGNIDVMSSNAMSDGPSSTVN